jgi:condensin complex subunit 2
VGGFDDVYDGDGDGNASAAPGGASGENDSGDRDLLSETQGLGRKVRPETVNYARRAKRVDVRKLKENIWKGLDIIVPEGQGEDDEDRMVRLQIFNETHSEFSSAGAHVR